MLRVEVYINRRCIATAHAINQSDLAGVSDYTVAGHSLASPVTGEPAQSHHFAIEGHDREQTAWALVAKMANRIAELEAPTALNRETDQGERREP